MILEEVQDLVGVLNGGGNTNFILPFGSHSGEVPPVLPFLCLCFERLVVLQVDSMEISDGLGREGNMKRCVGSGGRHHLVYGCDKAPEDIGSHGQILCVFFSIVLIPSCPHCHFLIGRNIGWV